MRKLIFLTLLLAIFGAAAPAPAGAAARCSTTDCGAGNQIDLSGTPLSVTQCIAFDGYASYFSADSVSSGVIVKNVGSKPITAFRALFTSYDSSNSQLGSAVEFYWLPYFPYTGPDSFHVRPAVGQSPIPVGSSISYFWPSGGGYSQDWWGPSLYTSTRDHVTCSVDGVQYSDSTTWTASGAPAWPASVSGTSTLNTAGY
jgi:hypothetical protein